MRTSRIFLLPGKVWIKIRNSTLIEGIRYLTGFTADGYKGNMLNWEELTPVAIWMHLPSFQLSCYSVLPLMAFSLSISMGISHWKGSEQRWSDSGTNTALSSHCHIRSPWAHAAAYSNWQEFGSWWQLVFHSSFPFFFWISVFNKSLLCVALLCHLCTEEEIAVWLQQPPSREEKPPSPPWAPRASVIPFCVSVTLQMLQTCDAQRPNCPRRPNTPRK